MSYALRAGDEISADWPSDGLGPLIHNFAGVVGADAALLCQADAGGGRVVCSWGVTEPSEIEFATRGGGRPLGAGRRGHGGGFIGRALSDGRPAVEALDRVRDAVLIKAAGATLSHALAAPVRLPDGVGAALIAGFGCSPDRGRTSWLASCYASLFALFLESPESLGGLLALATRDPLTGCLTYQSTLHELDREINRSGRGGLDLSCCFIDLNDFKRVNDHHGHLRGNTVLAQAARTIREGVRSCDSVGRYGGDEFVAILPQTNANEARALAHRLAQSIADANIAPLEHPLGASIGVAQWTPGSTAYELLARADRALLRAKTRRNGIVSANELR